MNLFITDKDPKKSAQYLDTLRLNKQILECAQIISTVFHKEGVKSDFIYKPTHQNHPITKWAEKDFNNFIYVIRFLIECGLEFYRRRKKLHKSLEVMHDFPYFTLLSLSRDFPLYCEDIKFYNCTDYKDLDVFEAYKKTLNLKWEKDKEKGRVVKFN